MKIHPSKIIITTSKLVSIRNSNDGQQVVVKFKSSLQMNEANEHKILNQILSYVYMDRVDD